MTQPLEVRLPAPCAGRSLWHPAAVLVGTLLVVAPLAAVASQGLDLLDRLDALMLALAGAVIAGWGVLQLAGPHALLRHDAVLRLDETGVMVRSGDPRDPTGALLRWPDLAGVEIAWWQIVPPYVEEPAHLPVLRFIAADDGEIALHAISDQTIRLSQSFGVTPSAAALVVVVDQDASQSPAAALAWLSEHRPTVPVEVGSPPGG